MGTFINPLTPKGSLVLTNDAAMRGSPAGVGMPIVGGGMGSRVSTEAAAAVAGSPAVGSYGAGLPVGSMGASGGAIGRMSRIQTMRSLRIGAMAADATAGGAAPSEAWEDTCGVCLDTGQFCTLQRCHHKLCITCTRELIKLHATKPALCPFCRALIMGVEQPK